MNGRHVVVMGQLAGGMPTRVDPIDIGLEFGVAAQLVRPVVHAGDTRVVDGGDCLLACGV
jgi:hypothetical protein